MADNDSLHSDEEAGSPEKDTRRRADRRSLVAVLAIAVVVFILIIVLMMARGCGSLLSTADHGSSTKQIVPAATGAPLDGAISVWVAAETDLQGALSIAAVNHSGIVDMGGGRFVVEVPNGSEVDAARRLREVDGVYDAGRVYKDTAPRP